MPVKGSINFLSRFLKAILHVDKRLAQVVIPATTQPERGVQDQPADPQLAAASFTLNTFSSHLKQLHRLTTQNYDSFEALCADYLHTGCQILGCPTGIISRVEGDTYTLLAVKSDLDSLVPNTSFELADTYCAEVVRQERTITYTQVGSIAEMKGHPVYQNLCLESYIGTVIWVNGAIYGTLNFSSTQVRAHEFRPQEREILELMAQSMGKFIAIHQSETQLRQQAEVLKAALQELRITQTQMIQSEKMSSLGQLVAGIAHEINNPVTFIYGNLDHVQEYVQDLLEFVQTCSGAKSCSSPEVQEKAKAIELEFIQDDLPKALASMMLGTERIRNIVLSLRSFSRMEMAEPTPVDVHAGLDNTLVILGHRLKASSDRPAIQVVRDYGTFPLIEGYAGLLNQVFMNLLVNAIDVLEQKTAQQTELQSCHEPSQITLHTALIDEDWIQITIADNGLGIPQTIQQRIFDPFFTTKPIGKGTGLGLSISYQIVTEKHGGRLLCVSPHGEGTKFMIQLPIHQNLSGASERNLNRVA